MSMGGDIMEEMYDDSIRSLKDRIEEKLKYAKYWGIATKDFERSVLCEGEVTAYNDVLTMIKDKFNI